MGVKVSPLAAVMSMTNSKEKIGMDALAGGFDDDAVTRGILSEAIKQSSLTRDEIADRMSHLLGKAITPDMLNNFTAESKSHRFPFSWCRAFCTATGDWTLLHHLAKQSGFVIVESSEADLIALGELVVRRESADSEITRHARNILQRRGQ